MLRPALFIFVLFVAASPQPALAQTQTFTFENGKPVQPAAPSGGGGAVEIGELRTMLEASAKVVNRDFKGAEAIYSQILAANGSNVEAYLQRGVVRRELGDRPGMEADARAAATLTNAALQANPRDPNNYYRRSMALRLLGQFDQAKKDLQVGMQLGGDKKWETDLKAIALEEKMAASAAR